MQSGQSDQRGETKLKVPDEERKESQHQECLLKQTSCGCCLMEKQMYRMEEFFNVTYKVMHKLLTHSKKVLDNMNASRSAFSVALNNYTNMRCFGPFSDDQPIIYKHVFLNMGDGYQDNGTFIAPCSGVYSFAVTVYSPDSSTVKSSACASLQVNGQAVAILFEQVLRDFEDSATIVVVVELMAGDQVVVILPTGCVICDHYRHFNTFTGFLLYATK
ncbi:complement C1q-like protein 4 [Plectropomus leopardus]|uniref:complement C1q-like protein 4 n=1 Tax=Plectropomus leopardus TaxID=160734 RepID=UPI001C4C9B33|nr:complement C1q-like protein 4 [Plectropomus leopardus]